MTIHRSHPTSAAATMQGDFVRITTTHGVSVPSAPALSAGVAMISRGMIGTIAQEAGEHYLVPDARSPELIRQLGKLLLSPASQVERISVDHEHEKAILSIQYLMQIADVARQRAASAGGDAEVARGTMAALLGSAVTTDLDRVVTELAAAGIQVVEKIAVEKTKTRTLILTGDPEAVRNGEIPAEAMTFAAPSATSSDVTFDVHDASRTREILLAPQAMREVAATPQAMVAPEVPATAAAFLNGIGMGGTIVGFNGNTLTADDVGLGEDVDDEPDGYRP